MNPSASDYDLYLDDLRPIPDGWVGVRSVGEFIATIRARGLPRAISFDHDLGLDRESVGAEQTPDLAPSGMDAARWLVDQGFDLRGIQLVVHSANPVGAANIRGLLASYLRHLERERPSHGPD